ALASPRGPHGPSDPARPPPPRSCPRPVPLPSLADSKGRAGRAGAAGWGRDRGRRTAGDGHAGDPRWTASPVRAPGRACWLPDPRVELRVLRGRHRHLPGDVDVARVG